MGQLFVEARFLGGLSDGSVIKIKCDIKPRGGQEPNPNQYSRLGLGGGGDGGG